MVVWFSVNWVLQDYVDDVVYSSVVQQLQSVNRVAQQRFDDHEVCLIHLRFVRVKDLHVRVGAEHAVLPDIVEKVVFVCHLIVESGDKQLLDAVEPGNVGVVSPNSFQIF